MPALPALEVAVLRSFRGEADYPHFARLVTAFALGEGSDRVETAEGVAAHYGHLERCDPERDLLVAEVDGQPVAYSRVWWDQEADGPRTYTQVCFVDPAFGGRGIGTALFEWNESLLAGWARQQPERRSRVGTCPAVSRRERRQRGRDRRRCGDLSGRLGTGAAGYGLALRLRRPEAADRPRHAPPGRCAGSPGRRWRVRGRFRISASESAFTM